MIRLLKRRLIIPQGDTGSFTIPTLGAVSEGDLALFGIFDPLTKQTVLLKAFPATAPVITISLTSEDTIALEPKKYKWDISIYKNPQYDEDNELIGAEEINSYYSAFKLPVCEITEAAFDMNRERWRTRDLLINVNDYQPDTTTGVISGLQAVYPWENIQQSQLLQQLYSIATKNGYTGSYEKFLPKFSSLFTNGDVIVIENNNFPIPGDVKSIYADTSSGILYYYLSTQQEPDEDILSLAGIKVYRTVEDEVTTIHLYIPIKALGLTN